MANKTNLKTRWAISVFLLVLAFGSLSAQAAQTGSIVGWGSNYNWDGSIYYGQATPPDPNGFVAIAAGYHHSLGLKEDGSVVAWGGNYKGQCNIPAPNSGFISIAGGGYHSLGLKDDSSVAAWGSNYWGQCNVPAPNSGFIAISAGGCHGLGLKEDGSIVAWEYNDFGQCNIPAPNSGFIAISAGWFHSLGLKVDGSVAAWGWNLDGQCNVTDPNGFVAIAAGDYHSLGLKDDGSVAAWGDNSEGQCNVPAPNSGFIAIAAGELHSLGLKEDGSVVGWGSNHCWDGIIYYGQATPPDANEFIAIAAGGSHSLGIKEVPAELDSDGDEIPDDIDNCPYTYNPGQKDVRPAGGDGIGDACQKDFDGDGFKDNEDNCPETPNPDQNDTDGDLRGNACDLCPDDPNDACVDVNTVIGSGGGTVTNGAGTASVDIPPGALTEEETISITGETDISNYAIGRSPDKLEIGYIYTFEPNGLTFSVPVTITLTYEQAAIPGQNCTEPNCTGCGGVEPKLDIYYYDDVNGWEPQDANQDCASNTLTLQVEHFSTYVVIAIRDSDDDEVLDPNDNCPYVYNPDQADSDSDGIGDTCECYAANIDGVDPVNFEDFAMLAAGWRLTVYDLAGDTNRDESVDLWDLAQLAEHWLSYCNEP